MNRFALPCISLGLLLLAIAGCGDASSNIENPANTPYTPQIDPANFATSTIIDNPYFPLTPGTTFVYEGTEEEDSIRIEETVTNETRRILGVDCVIVMATEWVNGELTEETFDWYAQDNQGNVWYFGEDTKEFEDGEVSTAGSWEAGVDGAWPGIIMFDNPLVGVWYRQEYYEGEAEDVAEILRLNGSASVPYGSFDGLLVTKEWTPLEPGIVEQDYYAPGVGLVFEEVVKGGDERIELVDVRSE